MTDALPGSAPPAPQHGFAVALLLTLVSVALQLATMSRALDNVYDEGLILLGAQRVLDGEIPYRDFWGMYPPGQFYAVAGLFKLFGSTILIERLWDVAIRAALTTVVFQWARRIGAGAYSYAAWLVVLVLLCGFGNHGFPIPHALLFSLLSGYLVLDSLGATRAAPRLLAAGACTGVAALFRHDIGFYAVLADALFLAWWAPRRFIVAAIPLALGAGLIVGAATIFLLAQAPLRDVWFNLFVVPATIYPHVRALAFPALPDPRAMFNGGPPLTNFNDGIDAYFPLVVAAAALIYLWASSRAAATEPLRRAGIFLLTLLTLMLYLKGLVRTHNVHVMQSVIPATALCAALLARMAGRIVPAALGALIAIALLAWPTQIAFTIFDANISAARAIRNETGLRLGVWRLCAPQPGLERARCFLPRPDDAKIARLIQSVTPPGQPVYVGPSRHDRIFVNNILLQYIMALPPATKWHESHPGIQTTAPIQTDMIAEFTARNVRYLVLSAEWDAVREPNASAVSSGITLLDDYVRANFDKIEDVGAVSIWRRR